LFLADSEDFILFAHNNAYIYACIMPQSRSIVKGSKKKLRNEA
jgi:hypothetical protein